MIAYTCGRIGHVDHSGHVNLSGRIGLYGRISYINCIE